MSDEFKARIGAYINRMEQEVCAEWGDDRWPECDCDDSRHVEGRRLLGLLGVEGLDAPVFAAAHRSCAVELRSEYGDTEPIEGAPCLAAIQATTPTDTSDLILCQRPKNHAGPHHAKDHRLIVEWSEPFWHAKPGGGSMTMSKRAAVCLAANEAAQSEFCKSLIVLAESPESGGALLAMEAAYQRAHATNRALLAVVRSER